MIERKERPILFSTEMVRAILEGRKTQTRRVCKHTHYECPFGTVGDILWVKETYYPFVIGGGKNFDLISYKANGDPRPTTGWKPSLFMPKLACRLKLRITNIRCERLNDISEEDAKKEGVTILSSHSYENLPAPIYKLAYMQLWESINGKGSWEKNPWVWVIEFEVIK